MSQKQNFIKTADKATADKLIAAGFQLISQDGVYTFLNQVENFNFENVDVKKIAYTNIMSI